MRFMDGWRVFTGVAGKMVLPDSRSEGAKTLAVLIYACVTRSRIKILHLQYEQIMFFEFKSMPCARRPKRRA
jgi:hypothetical protein